MTHRWWSAELSALNSVQAPSLATATAPEANLPAPAPVETADVLAGDDETNEAAPAQTEDAPVPAPRREATARARELVSQLTQGVLTGQWTPEGVGQWQERLQELIEQGGAGVAAIREFLERNLDGAFGPGSRMEYRSLRPAFFTALQQIGGEEARELLLQSLRTTAVPAELAQLARYFERQWPGQFREDIFQAARTVLTQSKAGELPGWDVGPVFQVLQTVGDGRVAADLEEHAAQWSQYSALALANLAGGQGIPSLIRLAQASAPDSSRGAAVAALAQVAWESAEARAALTNLFRVGDLPVRTWETVARVLAGERRLIRDTGENLAGVQVGGGLHDFHLEAGNQNYYTLPAAPGMPAEQIQQRLAVIEQMLAANPSAPAAPALASVRSALLPQLEPGRVN